MLRASTHLHQHVPRRGRPPLPTNRPNPPDSQTQLVPYRAPRLLPTLLHRLRSRRHPSLIRRNPLHDPSPRIAVPNRRRLHLRRRILVRPHAALLHHAAPAKPPVALPGAGSSAANRLVRGPREPRIHVSDARVAARAGRARLRAVVRASAVAGSGGQQCAA